MPAKSPQITPSVAKRLAVLGEQIRTQRKTLAISAIVAAEAAGMSRVTLHRIERGEPSVSMGAYLNAMTVLGLDIDVVSSFRTADVCKESGNRWIPVSIRLAEYPQLKQLAWQIQGTDEITPVEALGIYDRNWRHVDQQALEPRERDLIDALRKALGERHYNV